MEIYKESNTIYMKVRRICIAITVAIVSAIVALAVVFCLLTSPAVKINGWRTLDIRKLEQIRNTITVLDKNGEVIAENLYSNNRIYTPLRDIPQHTADAFISIEDKRFYRHNGVDYKRMLGAFKNNVFSGSLKEGASTITQQLIKNTHLSSEKTFSRKLQEIRIAKQLEKTYDKDRILEAYLNVVYFGNTVYGIGQAAQTYFRKNVAQLDIAESALLAGIINNPSRYNPYTHADKAKARRDLVLDCMVRNGKISKESAAAEKAKDVYVAESKKDPYTIYLESVIAEAADVMDCLPEELFERKYCIKTCLQKDLFDTIHSTMTDIVYNSPIKTHIIVQENQSARVLLDTSNLPGVSTLRRQPGSAIKPFIAFAPALEKKLVFPASVLQDEKTDFNGYAPHNFNDKYYGSVTVSDSLKYSLNVPAVKLTDMCGIPYSKAVAERFGIRFSDNDKGLAVALGGLCDGVTLQSLADAYGTLARGGVYRKSKYVSAIYEKGTACVYTDAQTGGTRAVGEDTAFLLTDMLRECAQSGTAKKLHAYTNVAAKTGTVERGASNSDAYCIAYTPRYTVAVWCGSDDGSQKLYGGQQPTKIAASVLKLLNDTDSFSAPESVELLDIDCKKLSEEGTVYLAAPSLQKRYRKSVYFSRNHLPSRYSYGENPIVGFALSDRDDFQIFQSLVQ